MSGVIFKNKHWILVGLLALIRVASFAAATPSSYCRVTSLNGDVIQKPIEISREQGGPIGEGSLLIAGLTITFESGWGGYSEETGGTEKYVFQKFTVSRLSKNETDGLGSEDLGETGQVFDLRLKRDPFIAEVYCHL